MDQESTQNHRETLAEPILNFVGAYAAEGGAGIPRQKARNHAGLSDAAISILLEGPSADYAERLRHGNLSISQDDMESNILSVAKNDHKAEAALRMMAVMPAMSPSIEKLLATGARAVFDLVNRAGISGQEISNLYQLCDFHPIKTIGVLYAAAHLDTVKSSVKNAVTSDKATDKDPFPANAIFQGVADAMTQRNTLSPTDGKRVDRPGNFMTTEETRKLFLFREMGIENVIEHLGDGNEEAVKILQRVASLSDLIDRNGIMGPRTLIGLDSAAIRGESICALFHNCGANPVNMAVALCSRSLGLISSAELQAASSQTGEHPSRLDFDDLTQKVTEAFPVLRIPVALQKSESFSRALSDKTTEASIPSVPGMQLHNSLTRSKEVQDGI